MAQMIGLTLFGMILIFGVGTTIAETSQLAIKASGHVDCERQCPYYYFPICATNGNVDENRMFVNICEMHAWNCDAKKKFRRTRNNQCKDYKEFVDDAWLNSHKPSKIKHLTEDH